MTGETIQTRWRCREGVTLTARPEPALGLNVDGLELDRVPMRPAMTRCLTALNEGMREDALARTAADDLAMLAQGYALLNDLRCHGLLLAGLYWRERRLATLLPLVPGFALPGTGAPDDPRRWRLSRFAMLRRKGRHWVLECTEAPCEAIIEHPGIVRWLQRAEATAPRPESPRFQLLSLLARLEFLENPAEDEPSDRRMWEFHDRLFHSRTRTVGRLRPFGATNRFREANGNGATPVLPRPPAIRPPYAGTTLELEVPQPASSRPLAEIMERRRSRQAMGDPPVSSAQAAALLHRVARIVQVSPDGYAFRHYPSAGGAHELEFYLAVGACRGLEPGFYHYRSDIHALTRLAGEAAAQAAAGMIGHCADAWDQPANPPQCLAVVSSRLPRMAWTYEAIAYRNSLLGAGVVLQSLYLVTEGPRSERLRRRVPETRPCSPGPPASRPGRKPASPNSASAAGPPRP